MEAEPLKKPSPLGHRILVFFLSALLTLLVFWLLGFVISDIGRMPGPEWEEIEARHVSQADLDRLHDLRRQDEAIGREIQAQSQIQGILQTSLGNSRSTMDQLMGLHRLSLEQGVTPSSAEQVALAESEHLFLENQRRFQEANEQIARLSEEQRQLRESIRLLGEDIEAQREPAREEQRLAREHHSFIVGVTKLAFIVPVLLIAGWFAIQRGRGPYAPIIWSFVIAALWRMTLVMHEHFPRIWFKYIATAASIVIVLAFLVHVIRVVSRPKRDWLLRQHRLGYRHHQCPICGHPIARGPLRHAMWTRKGPSISPLPTETEPEEPYTCPSCGTALFEKCAECGAIRHSLLPHCEWCGAEKAELST
ncbi:hypothetical protein JXA47_02360 [Candidatus Sumerlaeota bacterium]|nr:hypothetical protein [Candidatus Sumerlaeota bacterium]